MLETCLLSLLQSPRVCRPDGTPMRRMSAYILREGWAKNYLHESCIRDAETLSKQWIPRETALEARQILRH